jgi:hypothetical protein
MMNSIKVIARRIAFFVMVNCLILPSVSGQEIDEEMGIETQLGNVGDISEDNDSFPIEGSEAVMASLQLVANSDPYYSIEFALEDGTEITRKNLFGGFVDLGKQQSFASRMSSTQAFSNAIALSPEQIAEVKSLRNELLKKLKEDSRGVRNESELSKLVIEMNREFERRIGSILLEFQRDAYLQYAIDSVGIPVALTMFSKDDSMLQIKIDQERLKNAAEKELEKLESEIERLKKGVSEKLVQLMSKNDLKKLEASVGCKFEELILKTSLADLQLQLEVARKGGVIQFKSWQDFADEVSK